MPPCFEAVGYIRLIAEHQYNAEYRRSYSEDNGSEIARAHKRYEQEGDKEDKRGSEVAHKRQKSDAYDREHDKLDQVLNANGGKIPFEIEEYSSPQTLQVVTYDGAGNVSTTIRADGQNVKGEILWDGVLVTRNVASQVFYNRPVFFGLVGAGILLALFFILFMKRRKEQEEENA